MLEVKLVSTAYKGFSGGVLGNEFKELKIKWGRTEKIYTPNPSKWALKYVLDALKFLNESGVSPGLIEAINYFVSCIAHANRSADRKRIKLNELLEAIDRTLEDDSASDIVKNSLKN